VSLDVYLIGPDRQDECVCECGHAHVKTVSDSLYDGNVTHNLGRMAGEAGIYQHLWRPEELGITTAKQLVEPLKAGLELLRAEPDRFKALNPENGWGDYDGLVRFVTGYLMACEDYPDATVRASR
jgi:hypothetical protein